MFFSLLTDGANLLTTIGAQDFVAVRVTSTGRRARSDELHVAQVIIFLLSTQ